MVNHTQLKESTNNSYTVSSTFTSLYLQVNMMKRVELHIQWQQQ